MRLHGVDESRTVTVRAWRPDDRLTLPGSRGARGLKRLFAEAGIDPIRRDAVPVICVAGRAAAVCGLGIDRAFTEEKTGEAADIIWKKKQ
jgi:tRNA(Ile)-lysidine synthase